MDLCSTSFDDLPYGLVTDILSRLPVKTPVKTLVQSTSVCRIWYSIIKSPSLVSAHFSRSTDDPSRYYTLFIRFLSPSVTVVSDNHLLTRNPDINFRFETQSKSQMVIGTCNGLVCLTDCDAKYRGREIYLINPFIHKYKRLVVESSCYADFMAQINCTISDIPITGDIQVGFGYSEDENDYKVVRILTHYSGPEYSDYTNKVEIYSLKSRTWKGIDASFEIQPNGRSVFVHGCLYWCLCEVYPPNDPLLPNGHLLCFDLKDEVFRQIKLPTVFFENENCYRGDPTVLVKNGSVAVSLCRQDIDINHTFLRFFLLVLENDIGGQIQWKELCYDIVNFNPGTCIGFSVCRRLLFSVDWFSPTWNMVAVDLDNSCSIEKLELDSNMFIAALNVMESLILFLD